MIRKAKPSDSEVITRIHINTWKTTYSDFFPEEVFRNQENGFEQRNNNIKKAIEEDNKYHYIVYEEDNTILGFACYGKGRGNNYTDMGEVYSIYRKRKPRKRYRKKIN